MNFSEVFANKTATTWLKEFSYQTRDPSFGLLTTDIWSTSISNQSRCLLALQVLTPMQIMNFLQIFCKFSSYIDAREEIESFMSHWKVYFSTGRQNDHPTDSNQPSCLLILQVLTLLKTYNFSKLSLNFYLNQRQIKKQKFSCRIKMST